MSRFPHGQNLPLNLEALHATSQYIDLHYYFKPKREMQILKEATINTHFYAIQNNYDKLTYSYNIVDIIKYIVVIIATIVIIVILTYTPLFEKYGNLQLGFRQNSR